MSVVAKDLALPDLAARPMVHKFGGSSLAHASAIQRCVNIVAQHASGRNDARYWIVVSAPAGVTDSLLGLADEAANAGNWQKSLTALRERITNTASELLGIANCEHIVHRLHTDIAQLITLLTSCAVLGTMPREIRDAIAVHGEVWSMRLFAAALRERDLPTDELDARQFLCVENDGENRNIDWRLSAQRFEHHAPALGPFVVVPGYIASTRDGRTVTLGRNGSDWSATALGRLANAAEVTIWTDTDGVLEADPDVVDDARVHAVLARDVASKLALAGARILHPETLSPLLDRDTKIRVRSSFDSGREGTRIVEQDAFAGTVVTARDDASGSVVTVVGSHRSALHALRALDNAAIATRGIQTANEVVEIGISRDDRNRAQRVLHRALCRGARTASVVLLGAGNVGSEFLRQLAAHPNARLLGVANSRVMLFNGNGLDPGDARRQLAGAATISHADTLVERLLQESEGAPIIIDTTASESIARRHATWLDRGAHVVTANKLATANGWVDAAYEDRLYGDAATVGAGLPILSTIRRLRAAGDTITRIEGVLSGSLAFLLHALHEGIAFSGALREAQRRGLTEPDPRADLGGLDVARKLSILLAASGFPTGHPLHKEPLLPDVCNNVTCETFLASLHDYDAEWRQRVAHADTRGSVLRYIASATAEGVSNIGLREIPRAHPLAQTSGTDNGVSIYSRTYTDEPLVIRGPGAGAAVTARTLLADVADVLLRFGN